MNPTTGQAVRAGSTGTEEILNSVTHGVGFLAAAAIAPLLILQSVGRGTAADVVGASVFAASLILLYLASTVYHAVPRGPAKSLLQRVDHAAIYLLIAGTYTPFTLGALRGGWGWTLFGVVWGAAAIGVAAKLVCGARGHRLSTTMYVAMGWLVLVAVQPLVARVPLPGILWLLAGGLFYSAGVAFYVRSTRYSHAVWHLFVLGGSVCHTVSVMGYAIQG